MSSGDSSWNPAYRPNSILSNDKESTSQTPQATRPDMQSTSSWHPAWRPESHNHSDEARHIPQDQAQQFPIYKNNGQDVPSSALGIQQDAFDNLVASDATQSNSEESNIQQPEAAQRLDDINRLTEEDHAPILEQPIHASTIDWTEDEEAGTTDEWHIQGPGQEDINHDLSHPLNITNDVQGSTDDLDQEWASQITHDDAFHFMPTSNRSNSFPVVPPLDNAHPTSREHPSYHSQAAEIIAEVNEDDNQLLSANEIIKAETLDTHHAQHDRPLQDLDSSASRYPESFINSVQEDQDIERLNEGLPLVPHPEFDNQDELDFDTLIAAPEPPQGDHPQFPLDDSIATVPHLDRKSTMQILDTMRLQSPTDEVDDDDDDADDHDESTLSAMPIRKPSVGGQIASSKHTILQQVLDNTTPLSLPDNRINHSPPDDIAAQWAAALADNELLDDDDLLPDDDDPEPAALDPATLFGDDADEFLPDDENDQTGQERNASHLSDSPARIAAVTNGAGQVLGFDTLSNSAQSIVSSAQNRYAPAGATTASNPTVQSNPYRPAASIFTDSSAHPAQLQSSIPQQLGTHGAHIENVFGAQPLPIKPELHKTTSFADQSKGGYQSPYDLPMDVVIPKKRQSMQHMTSTYTTNNSPQIAPPRTSSMNHSVPPPRAGSNHVGSVLPLQPTESIQSTANIPRSEAPVLRPSPSFFEDLPITTVKPRSSGRYTPVNNVTQQAALPQQPPLQAVSQNPPFNQHLPPQQGMPQSSYGNPTLSSPPQTQHGLTAPPPMNPYANIDNTPQPLPQSAPIVSRYSPVPPVGQTGVSLVGQGKFAPPPSSRQSSSFYAGPPQTAHQPRTSSPLAYFERSKDTRQGSGPPSTQNQDNPVYRGGSYNDSNRSVLAPTFEDVQRDQQVKPSTNQQMTPLSPSKRAVSNYMNTRNGPERGFAPPQRSQTQSPGRMRANVPGPATPVEPMPRPSSVHGPSQPHQNSSFVTSAPIVVQKTRTRGMSQNFTYVQPTDGREHDPLQRWKGVPIFAWGSGGTVITTFPKHVPRYGIQTTPVIVCNPGAMKTHSSKDVCPIPQRLANFPGPLKSKSKKKELLVWLKAGISTLEAANQDLPSPQHLSHTDKRREERLLLWKILTVLIEHDGMLEGSDTVNKAVRDAISPNDDDSGQNGVPNYATGADLSGIYRRDGLVAQAEAVDPTTVEELRKHLLRGEREQAVWLAVDKRLWAHAMLISNTVSRDLYKRVAQEFIQKEVRCIGENTEPLAALYEVFAGNFEESVDELVPASARAGFQMVSSSGPSGPQKDALDGLDRWRETLGLYLSNRSPDDAQAIVALGRLLAGYGRAEAAHTCYLFARDRILFGGVDDPNVNMVLVGFEHFRVPPDCDKDLESIMLSEVYEFAVSVLAGAPSMPSGAPHLAAYKVHHATMLAESGQRDKALQYCDIIATSVTSQTKRSPYYHTLLVNSLDDLSKRLKASPKDPSSSWISKPSIDKVSSSLFSKFNDFVTGGEKDDETAQSGESATEVGPFARIAGGTPVLSRETSSVDLRAPYAGAMVGGTMPIPAPLGRSASRYAPTGSFNPTTNDSAMASPYGSQQSSYSATGLDQHMYNATPANSQMASGRYAVNTGDRYTPSMQSSQSVYTPSYPSTPATEVPQAASMYSSPQSIAGGAGLRSTVGTLGRPAPQPQNSYNFPRQTSQPSYSPESQPSHASVQYGDTDNGVTEHVPDSVRSESDNDTYGYQSQPRHGEYQAELSSQDNSMTPTLPIPSSTEQPQSYMPYESGGDYGNSTENAAFQPLEQNTGYVPYESTTPYIPADDESDTPTTTKPRRGPMYDDEDDEITTTSQSASVPRPVQEKSKAEKDREADEAFRRAAEEDDKKAAAAAAAAPAKKGWGWNPFGGGAKKEPPAATETSTPNKPIKAKLGEESSFVYDPDLKRWVNKKAGAEEAVKPATPPPPPSRSASGTSISKQTTSAPPSRNPSGVIPPQSSRQISTTKPDSSTEFPPPSTSTFPIPKNPPPPSLNRMESSSSLGGRPPSSIGSAPPSRPGTAGPLGAKSDSLDDLLGPPSVTRRAGAAAKGKKKARGFVDVMGDKLGS